MTFPFPSHYLPSHYVSNSFYCLGHFINVYDDDDDDDDDSTLLYRAAIGVYRGCML